MIFLEPKKPSNPTIEGFLTCVPAETRTLDPLIKSQLLYQLSYGDNTTGSKPV